MSRGPHRRVTYGEAFRDSIASMVATACAVAFVAALVMETSVGSALWPSLAVLAAYFVGAGAWFVVFGPRLLCAAAFRALR